MMLPNARTSASLYSAHTHTVLESSKIKSCKNAIQCSHYIAALLMLHCTVWYSLPCSACIVLLSVFLRTVQSSQQSLNFESCAKMDKCIVYCVLILFHTIPLQWATLMWAAPHKMLTHSCLQSIVQLLLLRWTFCSVRESEIFMFYGFNCYVSNLALCVAIVWCKTAGVCCGLMWTLVFLWK